MDGLPEEKREQLVELQSQMLGYSQSVKQASIQMQSRETDKKRLQLTMAELEETPEDVKLYKSLGKMFVLTERKQLETDLKKAIKEYEEESSTMKNQVEFYKKKLAETERQARELFANNPQLAAALQTAMKS